MYKLLSLTMHTHVAEYAHPCCTHFHNVVAQGQPRRCCPYGTIDCVWIIYFDYAMDMVWHHDKFADFNVGKSNAGPGIAVNDVGAA
ncbi:MAG: hypothetical protein FWH22_05835, partial [Fibromonadales bacterium]|nr:hypothetical protein [Fibromonadales bacterium]